MPRRPRKESPDKVIDVSKSIWWCVMCKKGAYGIKWERIMKMVLTCGHTVSHNYRVSLHFRERKDQE